MFKPTTIRRILKPIIVAALAMTTLAGLASSVVPARAAAATYNVIAGTDTAYGVTVLAFSPQTLKVHKGDTVTWQQRGFHNVHFAQKPLDLVVVNPIDGKPSPELNPAIVFPNIKSGDAAKPDANSGVIGAADPTVTSFSMVIDLAPGTYNYLCDIHVGMVGTIIVVDDATAIPSPADIDKAGQDAVNAAVADGGKAYLDATQKFTTDPTFKTANLPISAGATAASGNTVVVRFFPAAATIQVGQSVTWTVPSGFEPHSVNFPLAKEGRLDFVGFMLDSKKQPHAAITDAGNANVKSGAELPADGVAKSGPLFPGQSFTLKFTKPGVYQYYCAIHPDQFGVIEVVAPPQPPQ